MEREHFDGEKIYLREILIIYKINRGKWRRRRG
jgi:hypothetical protein